MLLNSDSPSFGGSGSGSTGHVEAEEGSVHGRPYSVTLSLPPLGSLFLKAPRGEPRAQVTEMSVAEPLETSPESPLLSNPEPLEERTMELS